jgi:acetyl-CoA acetyltransferase
MNVRRLGVGEHDIKVAVIGVGSSFIGSNRSDVSLQEMIFEGTTRVLADAGIARIDLDGVILSASDLVDGRGIASMASAAAAGAYMKHETRTSNDGLYAVALAALEIWSGRSRTTLVMSWNKMSEVKWDMATPAMFEPFYERPIAMDDSVAQGLAANAYRLAHSAGSEGVGMQHLLGAEQAVIEERPTHADGAYGIVLAEEGVARSLGRPFVLLDSIAWGMGPSLGNRQRAYDSGLHVIAQRAYQAAHVSRLEQLDLIEFSARTQVEEQFLLDELTRPLSNASEANGGTQTGGEKSLAINPSGGFRSHYLMQAAGLVAAGNVVNQLRGRAAARQLENPQRGVAHGQSGPAAQGNVVAVFSSAERSS